MPMDTPTEKRAPPLLIHHEELGSQVSWFAWPMFSKLYPSMETSFCFITRGIDIGIGFDYCGEWVSVNWNRKTHKPSYSSILKPQKKALLATVTADVRVGWGYNRLEFVSSLFLNYDSHLSQRRCREPAREIPPMTRSCGETWRGKVSQVSRGPLPEYLTRNQNLSVYCLLYCTLLTLQGAIPNHLSLEKVNLELQLVSCIWKESLSSNPSDGSLICLTVRDFYNLW